MADENPDVQSSPDGGKPTILQNKAVLLGIIVVVQTLLAIGLTQFVILPRLGTQAAAAGGEAAAQVEDTETVPGQIVGLEEIIVTLDSDPRNPRYLRINVNLEVRDAAAAERTAARIPHLRDIVIMALSDESVDGLASPEGKRALRDEIFRDVAAQLPEGALMNVFFSDLVVQ